MRVGQALAVTLDALPGQPFNGNVYAVNPQLDTAGRAVVLRAQMTNKGGLLKPGMFARVRLTLSDTGDAVVVPEQHCHRPTDAPPRHRASAASQRLRWCRSHSRLR